MWRITSAAALALLLSGCISLKPKVPDQLISLTAATSAPAGAFEGTLADALMVLDPDTDRRLDVLRVPVQVDDATVAYLQDAMWVERPARQFRQLVAETIRARGKRMVFEGSDAEPGGRSVLAGRLVDMGYDARNGSAVVRYDAVRTGPGGTTARRFESIVPGVSPKAASVIPALNRAANDVAAQVADWVG